jgi:hypothetical protein
MPTVPPASTIPFTNELPNMPVPPVTTITFPSNENLFSILASPQPLSGREGLLILHINKKSLPYRGRLFTIVLFFYGVHDGCAV